LRKSWSPRLHINLPELADADIVSDNIRALAILYFASMLEEIKLFQVTDRILDLFLKGTLPIGDSSVAAMLSQYFKVSNVRFTQAERAALYARTLGMPGPPEVTPNREFPDLWLRFLNAVSAFSRHYKIVKQLRGGLIKKEQIAKAARDLATNLSLHGMGMAYFVAVELNKHVTEAIALLSDPNILNAFGAKDIWQLVEQVSARDLGGVANTQRYRTMASTGQQIMHWLASQVAERRTGSQANDPTDQDLINACEQWLAVTGTNDGKVDQYAQPAESNT
jgi:hypothetical protein